MVINDNPIARRLIPISTTIDHPPSFSYEFAHVQQNNDWQLIWSMPMQIERYIESSEYSLIQPTSQSMTIQGKRTPMPKLNYHKVT